MRCIFGLWTLILGVALVGCGSLGAWGGSEPEPESGSEPAPTVTEFRGAGSLVAGVTRVRVEGDKKITVLLQVTNEGDQEIRFKLSGVSLQYQGRQVVAKDAGWDFRELDIDLKPGQRKEKYWAFRTEEKPAPGEYEITVSGISTFDGTERTPVGADLKMRVDVR